jgi:hypothetical protein
VKFPTRFPTISIKFTRYPLGLFEGWFMKTLILGMIALQLWVWIGPQRPKLPASARAAIDHQLAIAINDLAHRADELKVSRLVVLHLAHDESCYATEALRTAIFYKGVGIQPPPTLGKKVRDLWNLSQGAYGDPGPPLTEAKRRNADAVVFGNVVMAGTKVTPTLQLADARTEKARVIDSTDPISIPAPKAGSANTDADIITLEESNVPSLKGILLSQGCFAGGQMQRLESRIDGSLPAYNTVRNGALDFTSM